MAERPFQPVPPTPLVADPTGDAIWKRWLQGLQSFLGSAVRGPGSSTDNAVARWDGTTGTFLNNSGVIIDDSNNVSGIANLTTTGSTILGDAAADTITFNAAAWTLANNVTATRAVGAAPAGISRSLEYVTTLSGGAGGTSDTRAVTYTTTVSGANALANAFSGVSVLNHSGTNTITGMRSFASLIDISSSGGATSASGFSSSIELLSTGNVGTYDAFLAVSPVFSSTGAITNSSGLRVSNQGNANVTNVNGVIVQDQTGATGAMSAIRSEVSAGTGKKNLNITGTADNSLAGPLYLAQDNLTQQTASAMYAGTGAPNNTNGSDGDFYLRGNGTVAGSNIVYHKEAGAWVALTGGGGGASGTTVEVDLGTPKFTGKFTITDAAISATSKVQCWQAPGPYTGKGTLADEAMIQPVQVIAVAPATGSAVVYWQTPPYVAMSQQLSNGKFGAAGATFDRLMNQRTPAVFTPKRLGKVRGNVKFTYTILS